MRAGLLTALGLGGAIALGAPVHAALVISSAPTSNVNCTAGVCTATAADAVQDVKSVKKLLQAADLKIVSGSSAQDIEIDAAFKWTKPFRLTLDSWRSITFKMPVTAEGTGAVTLTTNDGGTGGGLAFSGKGKLTFWDTTSSLIIGGHAYKLVNDIKTLASEIAKHASGNFALAKAYDASVDRTYRDAPIQTTFEGKFDGLGHAIGNLTIKSSKTTALFKEIGSTGVVTDLLLNNPHYTAQKDAFENRSVGGLAALNGGRIADVSILGGDVTGGNGTTVGGLVGTSTGTISRAFVDGTTVRTISSHTVVGGLVGNNTGTITRSHSHATVSAGIISTVAGLVGFNGGDISLSYAVGTASIEPSRGRFNGSEGAGGLVGSNGGTIDQSYAMETVYGGEAGQGLEVDGVSAYAGGLVVSAGGTITNSYAMGEASANHADDSPYGVSVGGLIGENGASLLSVYSIVKADEGCGQWPDAGGGLIGQDSASTNQSAYWDLDTSGIGDPHCGAGYPQNDPGLTGLTDAQLKSGLPAGFDPAIWAQSASINNGYPYLINNPPPQ